MKMLFKITQPEAVNTKCCCQGLPEYDGILKDLKNFPDALNISESLKDLQKRFRNLITFDSTIEQIFNCLMNSICGRKIFIHFWTV